MIDNEGIRTMEPTGEPNLDSEEYEEEVGGDEADTEDPYEDVDEPDPDDQDEHL